MKTTVAIGAVIACVTVLASSALADEVTRSTTTTTKTGDPVVVAPGPAPAAGVVVHDDAGCSTKKVIKTDGDTGDTVKKTATNCD